MRKILLISDTHGYFDEALTKHINNCDEVWHGGDIGSMEIPLSIGKLKPFKAVYGNIDGADVRAAFAENLFFTCEKMKVLITHIGGYPGKYPARIKQLLAENKPDIFICGHSHILKVMWDKQYNLTHMNPGACGIQGFHTVKTVLRFEIHDSEIKNLAVIELGKRTSLPS